MDAVILPLLQIPMGWLAGRGVHDNRPAEKLAYRGNPPHEGFNFDRFDGQGGVDYAPVDSFQELSMRRPKSLLADASIWRRKH
ncbi:hypothetical protein [Novosphingobium sp. KN65.2]|uniref:hypothetical protein n=1 Tax=Novosphingobium sp. KN65.2 TaxID=1478134 RepID=UPI000AFA7BF5|nr:hypothetical protein [Novosphingobium sp. KN65.2]